MAEQAESYFMAGGQSGREMKFHVCQDIRGALRMRDFDHFMHEDGRPMTRAEAFEGLCDELAMGHEVIRASECDNFDFVKGCLGHPDK